MEEMLVDVLVFAGMMAALGCTMKIILTVLDRQAGEGLRAKAITPH